MRFPNKKPKQFQVIAREWFDKYNGNSYFSARVYRNGDLLKVIPFQYGYGSSFEYAAKDALKEIYPKMPDLYGSELFTTTEKHENCLQRDCKAWGDF